MKIDNSQAKAFLICGLYWKERYANNLEPDRKSDALSFGTRVHQLLECRHLLLAGRDIPDFPPLEDPALEAEAQLTFAAYEAHYPEEPFEVVDVERYFEVPVGQCRECSWKKGFKEVQGYCESHYDNHNPYRHTYCGEFDAIVRMKDSGRLRVLETKTERRGSKDNLPDAWIVKSQVGLYQYAAEQIYNEPIEAIILNVITRQSPKGQERPSFRRDNLYRSPAQQREAVRNLVWVADRIEECRRDGFFPANRNNCVSGFGWHCPYYDLHATEERSEELVKAKFRPAEKYLSGL